MGVADGVGPALRDTREESLRGQRPIDRRVRTEAESGYAAHEPSLDSGNRTHRYNVDVRRDGAVCEGRVH